MILFSDLHLKAESEQTCRQVLDGVFTLALSTGKVVGFLGDFWHVRYAVPLHLLNMVRDTFHLWSKAGVKLYMLPGNHDQFDVNGRNALEVFADIPNVRVFSEPTHDWATGTWLPYRKDPRVLLEWLKANPVPEGAPFVAYLHHGIQGAFMNSGMQAGAQDGLRPEDLPFPRVYCGHWHRHQQVAQCVYVGSQWQTRADEAGQQKGVLRINGPHWEFIPLGLGARFHAFQTFSEQEVKAVRPGDTVRVPAGTGQKAIEALKALGADVLVAPEIKAITQRLTQGTLRDQAQQYVNSVDVPAELTAQDLMALYDEVSTVKG